MQVENPKSFAVRVMFCETMPILKNNVELSSGIPSSVAITIAARGRSSIVGFSFAFKAPPRAIFLKISLHLESSVVKHTLKFVYFFLRQNI